MLHRLGVETVQVRKPEHLRDLDGLIIPGGESTTFCRVLEDYGFYAPLVQLVRSGLPVWGTCAGMILLAQEADDLPFPTIGAIDIQIQRNAYGRQAESFEADIDFPAVGETPFHAIFIRAPVVRKTGAAVNVLASYSSGNGAWESRPVAVRQGNVIATSFHPELTEDTRLHRYFLDIITNCRRPIFPK